MASAQSGVSNMTAQSAFSAASMQNDNLDDVEMADSHEPSAAAHQDEDGNDDDVKATTIPHTQETTLTPIEHLDQPVPTNTGLEADPAQNTTAYRDTGGGSGSLDTRQMRDMDEDYSLECQRREKLHKQGNSTNSSTTDGILSVHTNKIAPPPRRVEIDQSLDSIEYAKAKSAQIRAEFGLDQTDDEQWRDTTNIGWYTWWTKSGPTGWLPPEYMEYVTERDLHLLFSQVDKHWTGIEGTQWNYMSGRSWTSIKHNLEWEILTKNNITFELDATNYKELHCEWTGSLSKEDWAEQVDMLRYLTRRVPRVSQLAPHLVTVGPLRHR